ncbi:unnamed protein product [Lampetra planeri]
MEQRNANGRRHERDESYRSRNRGWSWAKMSPVPSQYSTVCLNQVTLAVIELQACFFHYPKNVLESLFVFLLIFAMDEDNIHVNFNSFLASNQR